MDGGFRRLWLIWFAAFPCFPIGNTSRLERRQGDAVFYASKRIPYCRSDASRRMLPMFWERTTTGLREALVFCAAIRAQPDQRIPKTVYRSPSPSSTRRGRRFPRSTSGYRSARCRTSAPRRSGRRKRDSAGMIPSGTTIWSRPSSAARGRSFSSGTTS